MQTAAFDMEPPLFLGFGLSLLWLSWARADEATGCY